MMQNAILALFGICITLSVCELLLPDTSGGTKRLLRFIASLAVLLILSAPVSGVLRPLRENGIVTLLPESGTEEERYAYYGEIFEEAVMAQSEKDLCEGVLRLLEEEYGKKTDKTRVVARFDGDGALATLSVYLSGEALLLDPKEVERFLSEQLSCTVEVR